jgi:hypothetical protein
MCPAWMVRVLRPPKDVDDDAPKPTMVLRRKELLVPPREHFAGFTVFLHYLELDPSITLKPGSDKPCLLELTRDQFEAEVRPKNAGGGDVGDDSGDSAYDALLQDGVGALIEWF